MKIFIKFLISFLLFIAVLYSGVYFILPYYLNKSGFVSFVTASVKQQTGLILVLHNCKISVYPNLDIRLKSEDVQLFYPDKRQILDIKNSDINFSSLYLIKKELKISRICADEFQFTTKLLKNGKTTLQEYLEKSGINYKSDIKLSAKLPSVNIKKYLIKIKDEASGQKFKISGDNLKIAQNIDIRYLNFDLKGDFFCFDKKYLNYNLKLVVPKVLFEDVNKKFFDINVDNLYKYNFYADLNADLKIHENKGNFDYLSGKINIDNFYIILGHKKLPNSFLHATLDKGNAVLVSKFYTNINESADINAHIRLKKPYDINVKCKCPRADISNLQSLAVSVLEILKIRNNLSEFKTSGQVSADFNIYTNLKNLRSNGSLKISNASFSHKSVPLKITSVNALVDFSNNMIKIKKSDMLVNNQPILLTGTIDNNACGDILAKAENLDLNHILNAFPSLKPDKNLLIKNGKLSFSVHLKGKLAEVAPQISASIKNFAALDVKNNLGLKINELLVSGKSNKVKFSGSLTVNNLTAFAYSIKKSSLLSVQTISAKFDNKNIIVAPFKMDTDGARLTLNANATNYLNSPEITLQAGGSVHTDFIKSLLPQNIQLYSKGYLPVKMQLKYLNNETKVSLKLLANPNNYITPVIVNNFTKTNSLLNIDALIKNNDILINKFSLYYAEGINSLVKDVQLLNLKRALDLKGRISNYTGEPYAENLHLIIPDNLNVTVPVTGGSADFRADILINGTLKNPVLSGKINISSVDIKKYLLKLENAYVTLNKSKVLISIKNLKIANTDISLDIDAPLDFFNSYKINYVKLKSNFFDMDSLMPVMSLLPQAKYAPGAEFPYFINSGKISINTYKMGKIYAQNITGDISSKKNILYITNLFSSAYGGKAGGKITYNSPYMSVHADIQGRDMDAQAAAAAFLPQKQKMSGRLNFDASVDLFISEYEQMLKTMRGSVNVFVKNGHLGQIGRFEHFLYAQNLLAQRLIYASLSSAKQAIAPKDTGYITYLKGAIKFSGGYANLSPVLTSGPQMSMYITGNINLLNNYTNLEILGKISSEVSGTMGLLGDMTIKDFLDEHTKYGPVAARLFNFYNSELPQADISQIPALSPDYKYQTKNFRVMISGDPDNVKSVKSFTWVNPLGTKKKIIEENLPDNEVNSSEDKLNSAEQQPKNIVPVSSSQPVRSNNAGTPSFLDSIPDEFRD